MSKLKSLINEMGVKSAAFYLLGKLLKSLNKNLSLNYYLFYKQPLTNNVDTGRKSKFDFVWSDRTSPHLQKIGRPTNVIDFRFKQDILFLVGLKEEQIVSCAWFARQYYDEDQVFCRYVLPDNRGVWDFDIYVIPKYRVGVLFLRTWQAASKKLIEDGYEYSLSRISAFNLNSISSHEKLGAKKIGSCLFLTFGKFQILVSRSNRPYFNISKVNASRPQIFM